MSSTAPTAVTVLGSGRVATALAGGLARAGHQVTVGTRSPARAAAAWTGAPVGFAEPEQAVRGASVVVNATPGDTSLERLGALGGALRGTVLVDVANATVRGGDGTPGGLLYPGDSLAERLQQALPATRVVKTLNTMASTVMTDPRSLAVPPTAFLSGDDPDAKALVGGLLADLGWPADWIEDLGGIATARGPEALMLLVPSIMRNRGPQPFALAVAGPAPR
ncbi:NAD(P)-binding domain-containing protein [Streptacidiphilus sp. PB12-B1b]|uniref:NADPH-dependent F420 reductase n=1 Tax=Streptacidiphilus sp. PB12-B1b TaxID=2705012 RepID=UPI0015FA0653|nr:NAD(P)-binding domain-containing protein [Streptacidiphilus sp. PB12-B1b]QMU79779.1 NAD(P)-binding domain-containing protein [Streptacidiphilus sp. PB12-B1b]